jgi:hypothetical protein
LVFLLYCGTMGEKPDVVNATPFPISAASAIVAIRFATRRGCSEADAARET